LHIEHKLNTGIFELVLSCSFDFEFLGAAVVLVDDDFCDLLLILDELSAYRHTDSLIILRSNHVEDLEIFVLVAALHDGYCEFVHLSEGRFVVDDSIQALSDDILVL
jgi:hypothetical protein